MGRIALGSSCQEDPLQRERDGSAGQYTSILRGDQVFMYSVCSELLGSYGSQPGNPQFSTMGMPAANNWGEYRAMTK